MADLRIQFEAQDNARQQVLNLRRNIARVNAEILENNQLTRVGNRETRQLLQTRTAELRLQRQKLALEREQLSLGGSSRGEAVRAAKAEQRERQRALKDALTYRRTQIREANRTARAEEQAAKRAAETERRERKQTLDATLTYRKAQIKAAERTARAEEQAAKRSSGAQQAFLTEVASVAREANRALSQFTGSLIKSSSRLETFAATLRVAETDSAAAEQALERLLAVTIELVGIDTADLLGFYSRLRSVGIDADRSISAISGVTKAIAQQGKEAATTRLVLEQVTQALSSGRIIYQDFRTIFQQLPTFTRIASEALGENIRTIEDFRDVAKSTVGETEAIIRVFEHLDRTSRGADLSTLNAQLEIFRDLSFVTGADAGRGLSDLVIDALMFANSLLEAFRLLNPTLKSSIGFIAAIATGLTGLVAVGAIATVTMGALNASLLTLTGTAGLAGFAAFLAPAGPILLGLGLVAAGIYAVTSAVREHTDHLNRIRAAEEAFAVSLRETTEALQSNTGIEERVSQYEDYLTALERLRAISTTFNVLDVFGSGIGINIADELGFTDINKTIRQYESLVDILGSVRQGAMLSHGELQDLDRLVASTLTDARQSGNDTLVGVLEEAAQKIRELFMSLEQGRIQLQNVFRPTTESANQLTYSLVGLEDELINARNALRANTFLPLAESANQLTASLIGLEVQLTRARNAESIPSYAGLIDVLSAVQRESGFTKTELDELDRSIAMTLTDARQSGDNTLVRVLTEARQEVRELIMSLEQGQTITQYNGLVDVLSAVKRESGFTLIELSKLDSTIARTLTEARQSGDNTLVGVLEEVRQEILEIRKLSTSFEQVGTTTQNVFRPIIESANSLTAALERLRIISTTFNVLDVFDSGIGINIADELGLTDLDGTIKQYESLVEILSNAQRQSGFTITELRELDSTIANTLTEARQSGNDALIGLLEQAAQKVIELRMSLEQGGTTARNSVFTPITESVKSLSVSLIELEDQLIRAQNVTRSATGVNEIADSYMNLRNISQQTGDIKLQQIAEEIIAENMLLHNQILNAEEYKKVQDKITDLSLEYQKTKLRIEREITKLETEETKKRDQIAQEATAKRIAYQKQSAEAGRLRLREFAAEYERTFNEISSRRDRIQFSSLFGGLINQGQGFEEALRNTRNFFGILEANQNLLQNTQSVLSILTRNP